MLPDDLVVLADPRSNAGTGSGISVVGISSELTGILVPVSGVVVVGPGVGVVGVPAADVDVGGHRVDAGLEDDWHVYREPGGRELGFCTGSHGFRPVCKPGS